MQYVWMPRKIDKAYAAQLLGFAVPPVALFHAHLPVTFLPATLPFFVDNGYRHIPLLGSFADMVWKAPSLEHLLHNLPNFANQQTLDVLDPLYQSLICTTSANTNASTNTS
jgi:hypothetical protein